MFGGEYKVEVITLMKQVYQSRDLQRIDELMSLMFDETKVNVIVGTVVVRFFGICDSLGIKEIKYYYPNY